MGQFQNYYRFCSKFPIPITNEPQNTTIAHETLAALSNQFIKWHRLKSVLEMFQYLDLYLSQRTMSLR